MRHLLVTNDFPPKVGGIQTYLWELWTRLPPGDVTVLTTAHPAAAAFDAEQPFRIERIGASLMLPTKSLAGRIESLAREVGAELVVLDPGVPAGLVSSRLTLPYAVVMHGSELVGRLPGGAHLLGSVLRGASHVIAAGPYPAAETRRLTDGNTPRITVIPPGVDAARFRPLSDSERAVARARFGIDQNAPFVLGLSRLVPRKGFDVVIDVAARLRGGQPEAQFAIGGAGRDRARLERRASKSRAGVRFLGRVPDADLPLLYACADVFVMLCRANRWLGLEVEGFGVVFLEAASCGVAQVAGMSGGAADAVVDGVTGLVVEDPGDVERAADAIGSLLQDPTRARTYGEASRARVLEGFTYDVLASRLAEVLKTALASHEDPVPPG